MDKIRQCKTDLLIKRSVATVDAKRLKKKYELDRCKIYLSTKEKKKDGKTKMSDSDINTYSKHQALESNDYEIDIEYARVIKEHLDELRSLMIELMHEYKVS